MLTKYQLLFLTQNIKLFLSDNAEHTLLNAKLVFPF
jgi:hypothetical protein